MLTSRGLGTVLGDLAEMGFNAEWGVLSAADVGANHQRERIWIVGRHPKWQLANTNLLGHLHRKSEINSTKRRINALCNTSASGKKQFCNSNIKNVERQWEKSIGAESQFRNFGSSSWWQIEPNVDRMADGVVAGVDRLKAIGNGQVPLCAAIAWKLLKERLDG
jgi:DNA (cytosine-5)-methyltransferase 1